MKIKTEGDSEFERFERVMNKLLSVSHEEMQRRLATDPRGHLKSKKKNGNPLRLPLPAILALPKKHRSYTS
jgi:hypothetical protein